MGIRMRAILGTLAVAVLATSLGAQPALAERNVLGGIQWVVGDVFDKAASDYKLGMGFNLTGQVELNRTFDLRADVGFRWYEGESGLIRGEEATPDLGGMQGERIDDLRMMPATLGLAYRFEDWSSGRFWIPYVAAGLGVYDLNASFVDEEGVTRDHTVFKTGWNARAGVQLHRTSGLFVTLESSVHLIDLPGAWTPTYDLALGIGALMPKR